MDAKSLQPYFLMALIAASSILAFFIFRPFLVVLVLAIVFAVVLQPLYRGVLRHMSGSPGFAAFITMLISVVCILIPFTFVTVQIAEEAQDLYASIASGGGETYLNTLITSASGVATRYLPGLALSGADLSSSVDQYVRDGLAWLVRNFGGAFGGIARMLLSLFIFLIALYYFLRDGEKLKRTIIDASPLIDSDDSAVLTRLEQAINSVIRGSLAIAFIQGVLTGVGFAFFGVPNFVLWGVVAALAALIPGIGTSLVLAPGIAYLFIVGSSASAVGLLIWSVVAVGLIDNFLGPKLVGKGMQIHPLMILLSVFGGLAFFGPVGIFLGPLCISLFFALVSIHPRSTG
ncbi:AI-2E family transporter [Candidatus Kaiserbacteria bacterium]|nr:AI-2E family transporter [Candidatus Kaiserbacteria bacterium]